MFKNDITIQGGPFSAPVFFEGILSQRMNLVYGRNGSGKSSIARAFREQQVTGVQIPPERRYALSFDGSGSLPQDVQNHLFVFNEDFIDESVKVSKDGLKAIVRIGASAQLDEPIQKANEQIAALKAQREPLVDELDILQGGRDQSIAQAEKALKSGLKASGGFMDRLSSLEGRSNLTANLFDAVAGTDISSPGSFDIAAAKAKLEAGIQQYLALQGGNSVYWQAPDLSGLPDLDQVNALLGKVVRPAALNPEEQAILEDVYVVLSSEGFEAKTQELLLHSERAVCPLCHQPVTPEHKHLLAERLQRFRNLQEDDFKDQVDAAIRGIRLLSATLPALPEAQYQASLDQGRDAIDGLNAFLSDVRDRLEQKRSNPLSPLPAVDEQALAALVSACKDAFKQLDDDVTAYNQSMQEKQQMLIRLKNDNMTLAVYENLPWIQAFKLRTKRCEDLEKEVDKIDRAINEQKGIISKLQGMMDQVDDAREQINTYLNIIFGQKKLYLANAGKDKYKLQLRKGDTYVDIPPKAVSSGERNALALAYFFACVMERKGEDYKYNDPTLLVIDDPVSSFDAENKAGVISLLTRQSKKVLQGNKDSKILILTHDKTTLRELCAQRAEYFKNKYEKDQQTENYLRLSRGRSLTPVSCKDIVESMEYDAELNAIFDFAVSDNPEKDDRCDTMGNTIRRFAESYATRMFRCPWKDLFSKYRHLERLPADLQDKISSFAIRPILNSESHGVEDEYEPAELQRAARILLIYMSCASRDHLQAFLYDRENRNAKKMEEVDKWAADI